MWPLTQWVAVAYCWLLARGRLAGTSASPGTVWWLDLIAAGDGGARSAVCFMLVVSCTPTGEVCHL